MSNPKKVKGVSKSIQKCPNSVQKVAKSVQKSAFVIYEWFQREKWRLKMAKQMSVFNSAKKGVENQDLPARPWAQQVDNFQDLKFKFGIQTQK